MYQVSSAYLAKLKSVGKKTRRIRGSIGSVNFTENDILENSFSYTDVAVKSSDIKLGGVFIGSLKLTFLQSFMSNIPRGTWKGRVINCSIGLYLGLDANNQEIWEDVPIKPFTISEANHSALGIDITAYDNMSKFDSTIRFAEEQIERYEEQIAMYKKYRNPGWESIVDSLTRQISSKKASIASMKRRNK